MKYTQWIPTVVLTLSLANGLAQAQSQPMGNALFQLTEVPGHGLNLATKEADDKCGVGSCGAAKPSERRTPAAVKGKSTAKTAGGKCSAAHKKCVEHKCANHKCGANQCGANHSCGAKKK